VTREDVTREDVTREDVTREDVTREEQCDRLVAAALRVADEHGADELSI
jgi:hypothetical protein